MVIKVSAWKSEINKNVTPSTVNIAINDNHRLWPYNLRMPIVKWFSLIEALMISQILGKFQEKWNLKLKFYVLPAKWILCCKPFSCWFEWNAVLARWNWIKFQDLIWLPKNLMNLSFFTKILAEVCNWAQVLVKHSPTLGTFVSTKPKCIKLIFIGKIPLIPVAFLMALSIYIFFCDGSHAGWQKTAF